MSIQDKTYPESHKAIPIELYIKPTTDLMTFLILRSYKNRNAI